MTTAPDPASRPSPDRPEPVDRLRAGAGAPAADEHRPDPSSAASPDGPGADPASAAHRTDGASPTPDQPAPASRSSRPPIGAVALRPAVTVRAGAAPSRAEMADRPTLIDVVAWDDPLLDQFGHDPRSPYVERFWLGVLGPSATWLLRSFAHRFDTEPDGFTIDLKDTARALGIGSRGGANGALYRTMERVLAFGFARYTDEATLAVRRRMGPLNRRQQQRLPRDRQLEHDAWLASHTAAPNPSVDEMRRRARALALSLLELGEDLDATEQQLHRWRFHPAVAYDASRWAATVHQHRLAHGSGALAEPPPTGDAGRSTVGGDAA